MAQRTDRKAARGGWGERWEHGRTYITDGEVTYFIEARREGRYFLKSTGVHTEREALNEWSRFEDDPAAYATPQARKALAAAKRKGDGPPPILFDDALVNEFQAWSKAQGLTQAWLTKRRGLLAWWVKKLGERTGRAFADLRGLDKRIILACVPQGTKADGKPKTPSRPHRIAALKSLYEYLRNPEQRLASNPDALTLTAGEDPMIDFPVPQAAPAQSRGKKAPVPPEHLALVLEALGVQHLRDALTLMIGTGWRGTEIPRFAAEGVIEPIPRGQARDGAVAIIGVFSAKATQRRWKRVQVNERIRAAAERLRGHGSFDLAKLDKAIRSACTAKEIKPFGYGQIRHTVKDWTKARGVLPAHAAQAMGHTVEVAERFYGQSSAAPPIPSPLDAIA
jgi:hypothetical protein